MVNNGYTVTEIDKAVEKAAAMVSKFSEGATNPATVQFLVELYLGSLDNAKDDNSRAMSASN